MMQEPTTSTAADSWWCNRSASLIVLAVLIGLGALLRIAALDGVVHRTPDERSYTASARLLLAQGTAAMPALVAEAEAAPLTAGTPVRAGYLFLLAAAMRLTGHLDEQAGAQLSCAASILSMLLVACLAWRRLSPLAAWTATLLYAVSPLALMASRRAWQEAVVEALALLLLLIAAEVQAGARHPAWTIAFAALGAFALTIKQTAGLSDVLCFMWIVSVLLLRHEYRRVLLFTGLAAAGTLTAVAWLASLCGGWHTFLCLVSANTQSLDTSAYSIAYESGSPWLLVKAFAIVSLPTLMLATAGLVSSCDMQQPVPLERQVIRALVLFSAVFLGLAVALPHHLNLRYLAPVYAPAVLLAGVGMAFVLDRLRRLQFSGAASWTAPLVVLTTVLLLGTATLDLACFHKRFALSDMQDLSLRMVLAEASALPSAMPEDSFESWVALAVHASEAEDCAKTIYASTHAIHLAPDNPVGWNDLAAGFECSRQWPSAIAAAQRALQLQPDFQLARNNLNWSLEQQGREAGR